MGAYPEGLFASLVKANWAFPVASLWAENVLPHARPEDLAWKDSHGISEREWAWLLVCVQNAPSKAAFQALTQSDPEGSQAATWAQRWARLLPVLSQRLAAGTPSSGSAFERARAVHTRALSVPLAWLGGTLRAAQAPSLQGNAWDAVLANGGKPLLVLLEQVRACRPSSEVGSLNPALASFLREIQRHWGRLPNELQSQVLDQLAGWASDIFSDLAAGGGNRGREDWENADPQALVAALRGERGAAVEIPSDSLLWAHGTDLALVQTLLKLLVHMEEPAAPKVPTVQVPLAGEDEDLPCLGVLRVFLHQARLDQDLPVAGAKSKPRF